MPRGNQARGRGGRARGGGGRGKGSSRGGRSGPASSSTPFAGTTRNEGHALTLAEEARNTEKHWANSEIKLRYSKVNFVSAGAVDPLKSLNELEADASFAGMTLESLNLAPSQPQEEEGVEEEEEEEEEEMEVVVETVEVQIEEDLSEPVSEAQDAEAPTFIVDTIGSQPRRTGIPAPKIRGASPTPSDSSEEVILFAGRKNQAKGIVAPRKPARTITDPFDAKIKIVEEEIHKKEELLEELLHQTEITTSGVPPIASDDEFEAILPKKLHSNVKKRRSHAGRGIEHGVVQDDDVDDLIADYIANVDSDDDLLANASFNQRDLGGTGDDIWVDDTEEGSSAEAANALGGWDRSEIVDFDDLATSDGVLGEVQAIFSKRDRPSGLQYLVVWQDHTVDEARWVPATVLVNIGASARVAEFEAEEKLVAQFQDIDDEDSSDDSDDMEIDDDDSDNDEDDLIQRKKDRMTDESIARLLAKQEEHGMGSNELLLFDDTADADEEDDFAVSMSTWGSRKKKSIIGGKRPSGEFQSASALANAYDGFDVMDFERPSLQKKPKGRKGKLEFNVSDSDLEATMQHTWTNDRLKKKERKQEREELRAAGLLGRKNGKPDLKQKYKEGMGFQDVKEEIKTFLIRGDSTLALPPMGKTDRKLVHEIANAFHLKSKSAGDGPGRFPILYRTQRTAAYVEHTYNAVEAKLSRRYLPRTGTAGPKRVGRGGDKYTGNAAVSYRDGDIVGGSAPELAADNKGRAMLEKMGWSSGTALGALNNKGIMQPVTHVVKTTKAGLG